LFAGDIGLVLVVSGCGDKERVEAEEGGSAMAEEG